MRNLRLIGANDTGFSITERHFGGNIIATEYTDGGSTLESFREAIDELDISDLRYPAGQPDVVYADGLLLNGQLPDHISRFFDSIENRSGQVVIVIPTLDSYRGPEELGEFAKLLLEAYGERIRAFEVGNEYWQGQGETEYGQIANESILAIEQASSAVDVDVDIWVQMANAAGGESEFKNHPALGWVDRTVEANKAIIEQLSSDALAAMDGVVEHSYNRDPNQFLGDEISSTNMLWLDVQTWQEQTGQDFDLALTEWNIRTSNPDQLGVKAASTLIHHFENLVKLGAQDMHVWSPQHNSKTDLAGSRDVIVDADTGVVKNTVTGAAFDLMSSSLVGKNLFDMEFAGEYDAIATHGYANESELAIYIASRSEQVEEVSFSLGDLFTHASLTSVMLLGYDQGEDSSDGVHWSQTEAQFVESQWVVIDEDKYYLNEHDANAAIEYLEVPSGSEAKTFAFELLPYEVVELTYTIGDSPSLGNHSQSENLAVDEEAQHIFSINGRDTIAGGIGNDLISGGTQSDELNGGAGNDTIRAGSGFDTVLGGSGDDFLFGDFNADIFVFEDGHGEDIIGDFDTESLEERVDLRKVSAFHDFEDLRAEMRQDQGDILISTGRGSSIRIRNVDIEDLNESDFVF